LTGEAVPSDGGAAGRAMMRTGGAVVILFSFAKMLMER
jgi:hypothetical protein